MTKSITFRLSKEEYEAFTEICNERGYSMTGKIREFIRNMVKEELGSVRVSAKEWKRVESGINDIRAGKSISFEELKRGFAEQELADKECRKP
jgi:hypothetical protein